MDIYYDCEFVEDGLTIGLLSIGMVAEDGRELYRVCASRDLINAAWNHTWLRANVVSHLPVKGNLAMPFGWDWDFRHADWPNTQLRSQVARDVCEFIQATPDAHLWAWYSAYDHVALCQLWGSMIDLPRGVPMWTGDLKQEAVRLGNPRVPAQDPAGEHHALHDARHDRDIARFLREHAEGLAA